MGFTYRHYFQNPNDNTTFSRFDIKYDDIKFEWKTGNKASFNLDDKKRKEKIRLDRKSDNAVFDLQLSKMKLL